MQKRVFVRFDGGDASRFDSAASELPKTGLNVTDVAPIVQQISGTIEDDKVEDLRRRVGQFGGRLVLEEEDVEHQLPDPDSPIQ